MASLAEDRTTRLRRAPPDGRWGSRETSRAELIDVALGERAANLVVRGGHVVDVHSARLVERDIAIAGDRVALVGDASASIGAETRVLDATGLTVAPGLVAPHFHQWHSNHNPTVVAQCLLEQGTTAVADGFYGPAIVGGLSAVRLLAEEFLRTPLKLILLAPTHAYVQNKLGGFPPAPASPSEDDLLAMLEWPQCRGLEETFYDALCDPSQRDPGLLRVVERALELGKVATGHGVEPARIEQFAAWAAAGISNDHEAVDAEGVEVRLAAGLHVLFRHAPGFHNLPATLPAIIEHGLPLDTFGLCPDIAWADTIFDGCFDETVREAIRLGLNPISAIRLATILPARYFRVDHEIGSLLPGRFADLVLLSDLEAFRIHSVVANGQPVVEAGEVVLRLDQPTRPQWALATMNVPRIPDPAELAIAAPSCEGDVRIRVIDIADGRYLSEETHALLPIRDGIVHPLPECGINKVALLERLDGSCALGVGFVRGFGLRRGGMGSASNPLTQAVVAVAVDDRELAATLTAVVSAEGAFVAVEGGNVVATLPTPVFGQTSDLAYEPARSAAHELVAAWRRLGCELETPFAQLEFVAATSEPRLRISTRGLVRADPGSVPRVHPVPVTLGAGSDSISELERIADRLCRWLSASRVTVRLGPTRDLPILAEALDLGVPSLRGEALIAQMTAETVRWVIEHRRVLAVDDARTGAPRTPDAMTAQFGLRSFLIAPIFVEGTFVGTVSVHVTGDARAWTADDERAAADAASDAGRVAAAAPDLWREDA